MNDDYEKALNDDYEKVLRERSIRRQFPIGAYSQAIHDFDADRVLSLVVNCGSDIHWKNDDDYGAVHCAVLKNHYGLMNACIAARVDLNQRASSGHMCGYLPLQYLIQRFKDYPFDNSLICSLIILMLDGGARVDHDCLAPSPSTLLLSPEILRRLVNVGADINATNLFGSTFFMFQVKFAHVALVECALRLGANPNQFMGDGRPLVSFIRHCGDGLRVTALLLVYGADLNIAYSKHQNAFDVALSYTDRRSEWYRTGDRTAIKSCALFLIGGCIVSQQQRELFENQYPEEVPLAVALLRKTAIIAFRARALEICLALQSLELPAPQTIAILDESAIAGAEFLPYIVKWTLVTKVKHFRKKDEE